MIINESAPAKINLGLRITDKRIDGYHEILSVFQTVGICDELSIQNTGKERLVCNVSAIPADTDNLVIRAEELFCTRYDIDERLYFSLEKNIPIGAGLAGGSSDAAAALRGLRSYYGLKISDRELKDIAAELGSDIPFQIKGGTAVVSGRGEMIREVKWPFDFTYVIVYPDFEVSTAWAYRNLTDYGENIEQYRAMTQKLINGTITSDEFLASLINDFEPTVFREYPVLARIKQQLLDAGANASLLTGSGSSLIGIFIDESDAVSCADKLQEDYPGVYSAQAYY
ncbi:MAG: 4-(cytidine 5'-diphospho)-2-C-methyl-D-erythritol kinase [Candidatus Latescibacteria bacterium]|nr:4-(cytidine 5'-diphospho)-2-C-methyl-D-erythritol kinase [Candidatus Latescibacterota bacterium]